MNFDRALAAAHAQLDEATFASSYAQGQMMTIDQAVAYALATDHSTSNGQHPFTSLPDSLTEREHEILYLLADGLNSREVAERLTLSVGTVRWYLKLIYSKLDVHNRSEAIAQAKDLKLLI